MLQSRVMAKPFYIHVFEGDKISSLSAEGWGKIRSLDSHFFKVIDGDNDDSSTIVDITYNGDTWLKKQYIFRTIKASSGEYRLAELIYL